MYRLQFEICWSEYSPLEDSYSSYVKTETTGSLQRQDLLPQAPQHALLQVEPVLPCLDLGVGCVCDVEWLAHEAKSLKESSVWSWRHTLQKPTRKARMPTALLSNTFPPPPFVLKPAFPSPIKGPPFHLSYSYHLNLVIPLSNVLPIVLFTFLVSSVLPGCTLTSEDLELGAPDGREHATLGFMVLGVPTQHDGF